MPKHNNISADYTFFITKICGRFADFVYTFTGNSEQYVSIFTIFRIVQFGQIGM